MAPTTGEVGEVEVRVMVWATVAALVTVTVYVLIVEPFWAVTTMRIIFSPTLKDPVKGVVPVAPMY